MMGRVTLDVMTEASAPVLSNLLELYVHDLSEIFPIVLGPDGRFGYDKLPLYWSEPERHFAFLIRSRGGVAGFALVTRGSPATDNPEDLDLAEFFVLRAYRRSGVGRRAACLLWNRLPGHWIVRASKANHVGLRFWAATIREYTKGNFSVKEHPGTHHMFRVFSFSSAARHRLAGLPRRAGRKSVSARGSSRRRR
jgi:predicted acetyltransferase